MIETTLERWHAFVESGSAAGLDELLADDCVFYSPVVFTPQRGKAVTTMYLAAAISTFAGSGFRYVKEVASGSHAVLEFEAEIDGKYVNGVDILTCNDAGQVAELKVMVRPLQAVNLLHARMKAMLESLGGG